MKRIIILMVVLFIGNTVNAQNFQCRTINNNLFCVSLSDPIGIAVINMIDAIDVFDVNASISDEDIKSWNNIQDSKRLLVREFERQRNKK